MHSPIRTRASCSRKRQPPVCTVKIYGEYVENDTFQQTERVDQRAELEPVLHRRAAASRLGTRRRCTIRTRSRQSPLSRPYHNHLIKNFPQFDLGIPDQFRVDLWVQDFKNDVKAGTVPTLSILWIMCDHTGGPPTADAEQADNDLAVGRIIDYISHSNVWSTSAIFIEEDDAQNGVDHVDGHRSPAISSAHTPCRTDPPTTPTTRRST